MVIWKWTLTIDDKQILTIPKGAQFLTVQTQNGSPQIWALCDETAPKVMRSIAIYGTGHPIPKNPGQYIATFQLVNLGLVFHVFEIKEGKE